MRKLFLLAALLACSPAAAQTRVHVWHPLSGPPRAALEAAATAFNQANPDYFVQPTAMQQSSSVVAKLASELKLMRPQHPSLAIVSEMASGVMAATAGLAYPLSDLLRDMAEPYDPDAFMPAVKASFSDTSGSLLALPFLLTTPVLYYDVKVVRAAGFDPAIDLKTWNGLERVAAKLSTERGGACAFTMQASTWIAVENLMAMHDRPFASFDNGRGGSEARIALDVPLAARHLGRLVDMARTGAYGARADGVEPVGAFLGRACPMLLGTSGLLAHIRSRTQFELGVLPVPFHEDVTSPPKPSLPGGFAMWALRGRAPAENKGAAKFVAFLASPNAQAWLAREIRSIPSTFAGWQRAQTDGTVAAEPGLAVAAAELAGQMPTAASRSPRLKGMGEIEGYFDTAFDHAIRGVRQPHAALADAVVLADALLRDTASAAR